MSTILLLSLIGWTVNAAVHHFLGCLTAIELKSRNAAILSAACSLAAIFTAVHAIGILIP